MSTHSIAEAKNRLSELIDRARKGEDVVISRHGHPVAVIRGLPEPARPVTAEELDWLDKVRVGRKSLKTDAGMLLSQMRDEGER